jgi:hypothetical protein
LTLDITQIATQIGEMASKIKDSSRERQEHLKTALGQLNDGALNLGALKNKIAHSHTPWRIAGLYEAFNVRYPAPKAIADYTVLATDGSNIDVDRNKATRCYLINIGAVRLHYGQNPAADLNSLPSLYSQENDLVFRDETNKFQEERIEGALLDARRAVDECRYLAHMARAAGGEMGDSPTLAMMDGSLVMFGLESYPDFVQKKLLGEGFLPALDQLYENSLSHQLTVASYVSLPRSPDVTNALRIALCPQDSADCEKTCSAGEAPCDIISGLNDRLIFDQWLQPGERSALFINPSAIMKKYGRHRVYFYYLKLEDEIARIEVPEWVALRPERLDLSHTLVLDQCRRGQSYPVVLSEAHEQAVVTGADREEFWSLVEESMEDQKLPTYTSIKSRSKQTRWI